MKWQASALPAPTVRVAILLALPATIHANVSDQKLQVQQVLGYLSCRLAVGPRQIDYMRKTRPRVPRVRHVSR
jgi:hypothetical protein